MRTNGSCGCAQRESVKRVHYKHGAYSKDAPRRSKWLWRTYGLTVEQFEALLLSQDGRCAICENEIEPDDPRTHVDHCHETGAVRGILCHWCNVGIGSLREDLLILSNAIKYLNNHKEKRTD